jgi:hypothetical protein
MFLIPNLIVIVVVGRRDLDRPSAELGVHKGVSNDWESARDEWMDAMLQTGVSMISSLPQQHNA